MTAFLYDGRVPTLFVTGAPGAGKTALLREVSEILSRAEEPHAYLDFNFALAAAYWP